MPDGLTRTCITSFAAALFGRRNGSERARDEGVRLYAECMKGLHTHLTESPDSSPGEIAISIGILAVTEVSIDGLTRLNCVLILSQCLHASSNTGWQQHVLGLSTFYNLCSFDIFEKPHVLSQYEHVRFHLILAAIASKKPAMFVSDEWKTRPWAAAGRVKSPRQRMLDHAAWMPDLYLEFSRIRDSGTADQNVAIQILEDDIQRLLDDLRGWEMHSTATGK
jgi:hypothetical protein